MEYAKELPEQFRTWVEFLDNVKATGLDNGTYEDVLLEKPLDVNCLKNAYKSNPNEQVRRNTLRFKIQYVKNMALEDLLSERMTKRDVIAFTSTAEESLFLNHRKTEDPIYELLRTAKRILLTSATK